MSYTWKVCIAKLALPQPATNPHSAPIHRTTTALYQVEATAFSHTPAEKTTVATATSSPAVINVRLELSPDNLQAVIYDAFTVGI